MKVAAGIASHGVAVVTVQQPDFAFAARERGVTCQLRFEGMK